MQTAHSLPEQAMHAMRGKVKGDKVGNGMTGAGVGLASTGVGMTGGGARKCIAW